jgi:cytochrome c-type biogenesis protein CcmH
VSELWQFELAREAYWFDQAGPMTSYFWFTAGMLAGIAVAFLLIPLRHVLASAFQNQLQRYAIPVAVAVVFGATTLLIYRMLGRPDMLAAQPPIQESPHFGARAPESGEALDSVAGAAASLEQRITRDGGTRSDWLLVAQSYDFLDRPEDAARARARADAPESMSSGQALGLAGQDSSSLAEYQERAREEPRDAEAWRALAALHRQQRDFSAARDAFAELIKLEAMSADTWADYADVLGSLSGSLAGAPSDAIERALAIDGTHSKALWLKASLAHEQQRYADSLALWKKLRAVLPPDSPDARIVDSNIAEAAELAGLPPAQQSAPASSTVAVRGTVSIDSKLAGRVAPGATLFIYAKAADSPGPPLAVLRMSAAKWPVRFTLDDTLAMMPARRLSSFDRVIVEARISRSGQAIPTPGDFYGKSAVLRPAEGKKLELVISQEVS